MTADSTFHDDQADDLYDGPEQGPEFDEAEVLHFDVPPSEASPHAKPVPFRIGDDDRILVSYRPKYGSVMALLRLAESKDPAEQFKLVDVFMDVALDADSADYLRDRFEDPEDEWDYDVLVPVIQRLTGVWFPKSQRGSSPGGRATPRRTGRGSTVRRRSGGRR